MTTPPSVTLINLRPMLTIPVASSGNCTVMVEFSPATISSGEAVMSIVTFSLGGASKTVMFTESIA